MPTSIPRRRTVGEGARLVTLLLLVSPAMRALAIRFELARVATSDSVSEFFADRHARVQACFRRHACHRLAGGLVGSPAAGARLGLPLPLAPNADGLGNSASRLPRQPIPSLRNHGSDWFSW